MNARLGPCLLAALCIALAMAACSDDDNPAGGGTPDTTAPAIASVTPVDRYHLDVTFSEVVTKSSAEDDSHYAITETGAPAGATGAHAGVPGDGVPVDGITLKSDRRTVTISTGTAMSNLNYQLGVQGVRDTRGNEVIDAIEKLFTGTGAADVTPPQIVARTPAPGTQGVPIGASVDVQLSETVAPSTFGSGVSWSSGGGPVDFYLDVNGTTFTLIPADLLDLGAVQTIALTGLEDPSGNVMPAAQWSFTTTNIADITPPTLVSSVPANLATNVSVGTDISLTFSEAVNPYSVDIEIIPFAWYSQPITSNGGRTITFPMDTLLVDNQQYTVALYPGDAADLSGNRYQQFTSIVFTTGARLESGSIAGTIAGDPGTAAADPTGAIVLAEGYAAFGATTVAGNNTYRATHLADDVYELLAIKDTDKSGTYDFYAGDAIGAYGVDIDNNDLYADTVAVYGGAQVNGIDFPIYDPSAVTGRLTYTGAYEQDYWTAYVGLFEAEGFDPQNAANPLVVVDSYPSDYDWLFNTLLYEIPDGDYYIAAFIDVNDDGGPYDVDPYGWYGGPGAPTLVHIANGNDIRNIVFAVTDQAPAMTASGRTPGWRATKQNAVFKRIGEATRDAQLRVGK